MTSSGRSLMWPHRSESLIGVSMRSRGGVTFVEVIVSRRLARHRRAIAHRRIVADVRKVRNESLPAVGRSPETDIAWSAFEKPANARSRPKACLSADVGKV